MRIVAFFTMLEAMMLAEYLKKAKVTSIEKNEIYQLYFYRTMELLIIWLTYKKKKLELPL